MKEVAVRRNDSEYPASLVRRLGDSAPHCLFAKGNVSALRTRMLGLVCSVQCPGSIVIKTFDAIRALREDGVVVIGGFHSPMERECLDILLRGDQPVILCPARTLHGVRLTERARDALTNGQLLLLSPFDESIRRTTVAQAMTRNEIVAALADTVFVPHTSPDGKTWQIVGAVAEREQPLFAIDDPENARLFESGAERLRLPFRMPSE